MENDGVSLLFVDVDVVLVEVGECTLDLLGALFEELVDEFGDFEQLWVQVKVWILQVGILKGEQREYGSLNTLDTFKRFDHCTNDKEHVLANIIVVWV